jgi:hypothetical protein
VQLTVQYKANVKRVSKSLRYQEDEDDFLQLLKEAWKMGSFKSAGPLRDPIAESSRTRLYTASTMSILEGDDSMDDSLSVSRVNDLDDEHPCRITKMLHIGTLHDGSQDGTKPCSAAMVDTSDKSEAHTISSFNDFDPGSHTRMLHDITEDWLNPSSGAMEEASDTSRAPTVVDVDRIEATELASSGEVDSVLKEGPIEIEV